MRILHVDETFHPSYGYQVNPLAKFQIKQGHDVSILAPTREYMYPVYREFGDDGRELDKEDMAYENATGVKIVRVAAKGYFMRRLVYGTELFRTIKEINPEVIFVHCVETLTAMRFLLRKKDYPMVFDSHMLSMASQNRFAKIYEYVFRNVFAKIIIKNQYNVIRTQNDDYVNKHLGIPYTLTPFISFGTDTILFRPSHEARHKFRMEHGIAESDFVVIYTGKLTSTKGGKMLAEAFNKKFDVQRKIVLVVVGTPTKDKYGQEVESLLKNSPNRVLMFPTQPYMELAQFYQAADLSVFPTQCSMSFYDAQACGLPVLSEDNNVNVDRCSYDNGFNFRQGDIEDFRAKIIEAAELPEETMQQMSNNACSFINNGYDYQSIAQQYTNYLTKAVKSFHSREDKT